LIHFYKRSSLEFVNLVIMSIRHSEWDVACKVYIGGLSEDANRYDLEDAFTKFGPVKNVWVARRPPGFAFVEMEDPRDAEDAVRGIDGTRVAGNRVKVEMSTGKSRDRRDGDRDDRRGGGDRRDFRGRDDRRGGGDRDRGGDRGGRGGDRGGDRGERRERERERSRSRSGGRRRSPSYRSMSRGRDRSKSRSRS